MKIHKQNTAYIIALNYYVTMSLNKQRNRRKIQINYLICHLRILPMY